MFFAVCVCSQMYLSHAPSMDVKPGPGILKTPSVSTYGKGSEYGSDSGIPNNYGPNGYPYGNQYGEPEFDNSANQHEVFKIDAVQDPRRQSGPIEQSSVDYDQQVPIPIRQTTKKKPRVSDVEPPSPKRENEGRQMQAYPTSEGYDMYQGQESGGDDPVKKPRHHRRKEGKEGGQEKPRSHRHRRDDRPSRDSSHSNNGYEPDASLSPTGYYANVPGQQQQPAAATSSSQYPYASDTSASPTVYTGAGLTSPLAGSGGLGLAGSGGLGLAGMGGMGISPGMEQQLKINIRAQPNTAVHITPGVYHTTPPPPQQQPYSRQLNMSQSSVASVETEI